MNRYQIVQFDEDNYGVKDTHNNSDTFLCPDFSFFSALTGYQVFRNVELIARHCFLSKDCAYKLHDFVEAQYAELVKAEEIYARNRELIKNAKVVSAD